MHHKQNYPGIANATVDHDKTGQCTRTGTGAVATGMTVCRDGVPPLLSVAAAITSGVQPFQFMDSIHAGNVLLGNRAFLHWVGQLHAANLEPDSGPTAAPDSQNLCPTPADTAPPCSSGRSRAARRKKKRL